MRTKALVIAALFAAGLATSMAQNVYSLNIVGYVNKTVKQDRFGLISNPLQAPDQDVRVLFTDPKANMEVYKRTDLGWNTASFIDGAWEGDVFTVAPGEGVFVKIPAGVGDYNVTFVGDVVLKSTNNIPNSKVIRSSVLPQTGGLTTVLEWPKAEGDSIDMFDPEANLGKGGYNSTEVIDGQWDPFEPVPAVGEAFWAKSGNAGGTAWVRNFTVGP